MKMIWMVTAVVCVVIAIVLLLRRNMEAAFVMATIGTVAWFLNYRVLAKRSVTDQHAAQEDEEQFDLDEQH